MKKNITMGSLIFDIFLVVFFLCVVVTMVVPFINVLTLSLEPEHIALEVDRLHLFPKAVTFKAYKTILERPIIVSSFQNSVFVTLVAATLGTIISAMFAYMLSKDDLPGVKIISFLVVFTMMFKGGIIPDYLLIQKLGLLNRLWAVILPKMVIAYNVLLLRAFFRSTSKSLTEAAIIDGANYIQIFFKIVLPLSTAILATIYLFIAVDRWNSYFDAMMYISKPEKKVLQVLLREILISSDMDTETMTDLDVGKNVTMATAIVSIIPILCVYPFLQRYFTKGIMIGAVKG